jgi:site-specific recombinase XerD
MPRTSTGPWFRADRNAWYVWIGGKQHRLADGVEGKADAMRAWHGLMAEKYDRQSARASSAMKLGDLVKAFMELSTSKVEVSTLLTYRSVVHDIESFIGSSVRVTSISESAIYEWINEHEWKPSTAKVRVAIAKSMFAYAIRLGVIDRSPMESVRCGRSVPRTLIMSHEQVEKLVAYVKDKATLDLIEVLRRTGMRPSEAYRLEAGMIDRKRWVAVMRGKTTRATGKQRVIYFPTSLHAMLSDLMGRRPTGKLLLNQAGRPWSDRGASNRLRALRKRLGFGPECTPESFRHLWITDALDLGVDIAKVAELSGNSPGIIAKHYSKLSQREDSLRQAVEQASGLQETRLPSEPSHPAANETD